MKECVDLFCGCGGLSLGARSAGFFPAVSVDLDPVLSSSYARNQIGAKLLEADLMELEPSQVLDRIEGRRPLGVFGGPPCQGFSSIGRRSPDDPRNRLVGRFFEFVAALRPAFFLMENVPGLLHDRNRDLLDSGLERLPVEYALIPPKIVDASGLGAPTRRKRVLVVGWDTSQMPELPFSLLDPLEGEVRTVKDAIGGLPGPIESGSAHVEGDTFGFWLDNIFSPEVRDYRSRLLVSGFEPTIHKEFVSQRFASIPQGGKDSRSRYPRLSWDQPAPTLRAGTGSDKGSFQAARPIHPSEPRVITVREAARIQGFPDWYEFHPTKWHSHRMIGNSVSPIMSHVIFSRIGAAMTEALSAA